MTKTQFYFLLFMSYSILPGCNRVLMEQPVGTVRPGPRLIIYKTRNNFDRNVPVILSRDRKSIVSYPDISDIRNLANIPYPDTLPEGYLLDNRGIDKHVGFLKLSYEAYARLSLTPSANELLLLIADPDPLLEMYDCGERNKFPDPVQGACDLIRFGALKRQNRIK